MRVGDQLTTDVRFAQCKLEQACDPVNTATTGARHAVKYVRHATHAAIECCPGVFIPGIAMSATHADPTRVKNVYRLARSQQFGRDRYTSQYLRVFQQLPQSSRRPVLTELRALRSVFRF